MVLDMKLNMSFSKRALFVVVQKHIILQLEQLISFFPVSYIPIHILFLVSFQYLTYSKFHGMMLCPNFIININFSDISSLLSQWTILRKPKEWNEPIKLLTFIIPVMRLLGSKTSIFSSKSRAPEEVFGNLAENCSLGYCGSCLT